MIYVLIFRPPSTNSGKQSDDVVAFLHLWAAFKLLPVMGGIRLADSNDDLMAAIEVNDGFKNLMEDPASSSICLRPQGGSLTLGDGALALLKRCWSRTEQGQPTGLRAQLGTAVETIVKVEQFLKNIKQMTPDEYAEFKQLGEAGKQG